MAELGRKGQTQLHVYNLLHKLFEDAVHHYEILHINPVRKRYRPDVHLTERAFLTPEESWRLLKSCRDHWAGPVIWIAILSGLRPGEIQALVWDAVVFDLRHISIRGTFDRKMMMLQKYPKPGDWGCAPMPPDLVEYLASKRSD